MNKKIFYVIVLFGILIAGWYFFQIDEPMVVVNTALQDEEILLVSSSSPMSVKSKKVTTQKTITPSKNEYIVIYTEDGFKPSELQIPRGTPVKFVNKTSISMRIFADKDAKPPFSDLNQPKALGKNGEYVFNFVYSGIWKYNNSLHPEDVGNIVVY